MRALGRRVIVCDDIGEYSHHLCDFCGAVGHGNPSYYREFSPALPSGWAPCVIGRIQNHLCGGCVPKEATFRSMRARRADHG